ncbi:hypothetical protein AMS68_005218 [Peltaster fructicola]|uniref:Nucleoporin Nup54 alpha-helical domain-containing protein n=1 Tax=Peltaster fructicola TaxID=286661 RepID=A0A6H0XYG2_9PEZI|nr:hypothetical protein AMS68_005218 [Peltaster fructicola]
MALGRSNSLSLNTTAVNNSFASQQTSQPPAAAGGLFGGSIFGNQAAKPATNGASLFGNQSTAQPAQTGGLFGAQNTSQAGGLFGNQSTAQPAQSTGLFGNTTNQTGSTSLFGGQQQQQQQQQQQPTQSNSLFGGSLFGQSKPAQTGNTMFGASQPAQAGASMFGQSQNQAAAQQPSLLGASRYTAGQPAPFTGRLTMGQGSSAQPSVTPATKLDWANVRPTTRYSDLVDTAKEKLEQIDKMIQQQETFSKQIEAFLPAHHDTLNSLQPDIDLIKDKCDAAEQALISDAQGVQQVKTVTMKDHENVLRCERIGENLRLPAQYHYAPAAASKYGGRKNTSGQDSALDEEYDMNLVGNYFVPMAADMQRLLETYTSNLSEIEAHMSTIEATAIAQAQAVNQQRSGGNGPDSVRQLADTLRGFESTILATAAKVGAARKASQISHLAERVCDRDAGIVR